MIPVKTRLKDIALLAGVSIGTVDRVLHDRGQVAENTSERVKKIIRETNFSPDFTARALKTGRILRLASLLPEPSDDNAFWEKHPAGINKAIDELSQFRVSLSQITFDMLHEEDFVSRAAQILELGPDGVLLAPIFKSESMEFCRQLKEKKIPYVFVDGFIKATDFLAYIGEDAFSSGRVAGQLADLITPGEKNIGIISIAKNIRNVQHLNNRIKGFLSYFENSPADLRQRISISIPDPAPSEINALLDRAFLENPSIGTIYISGSKSYLIASYLQKNNLDDVHIIGYDLLDRNVSFLRSGRIKFLIGQRPEEQTYRAVRKLFDFLSFKKIPEVMEYLPVDIVTSENVDFFLRSTLSKAQLK